MNYNRDKITRDRNHVMSIPWRMYMIMGVIGLIVIGIIVFGFYEGHRMITVYVPLVDAAMETKLEATTAHLWFEEIISGDRHEVEDAWQHLDEAERYAKAMLEGGKSPEGNFIPLDDTELRLKIREVLDNLAEFKDITKQRLAAKETSGADTDIDQRYDSIFRSLIAQADEVENILLKIISQELRSFRFTHVILIVIAILLFVIGGITIHRFERRQAKDYLNIREINKRLEKEATARKLAEEALREANEGLERQVEERTVELVKMNDELKSEIEERKCIEEALRENETRYSEMFENMSNGVAIYRAVNNGEDFIFTSFNKAGEKIENIKRQELIGKSVLEVFPGVKDFGLFKVFQRVWATGNAEHHPIRVYKEKRIAGWRENFVYKLPSGEIVTIYTDETEQKQAEEEKKRLEAQLQQAHRMEMIGTLAGGVAHDFNNLLSVIMVNLSLAEDDIKSEIGTSKFLKEAEKASLRARDLAARLITFSKGGEPVKKSTSIGKLVKDSVISSLSGTVINCEFSIPDDLSIVEIDETQMKQAVHNIVVNAQEAMAGKGMIQVYGENVTIVGKDNLPLKNGKYVKLSIKDQGVGIPEENRTKIFDPYFSTKEMGTQKGMGLGLSICNSIVEKHAGLIAVESEFGVGTTFVLYLPASDKEIIEPEPLKKPASAKPETGRGKVLLMDDEKMIRDFAIMVLSRLGYDAEVSKDGAEAIELYKKAMESGEPFDAVILDLTNQFGMGGKEAIQKLIEIDPHVKGIVSTGYSDDVVVTDFRKYGFCGTLTKPYSIDELRNALSDVISRE